jgi:hypothetical protein
MSFIQFRNANSTGGAGNRLAFLGRGTSSGTDTGSQLVAPFAYTVEEGSIVAPSAPGGGNAYNRRMNVNGVAVGPTLSIADPSVSARLLLGVAISSLTVHLLTPSHTGAPANVSLNDCYRYLCDAPNTTVSLYPAGDESSNVVLAGTDRFIGFNGNGVAEGTATESTVQIDWPLAGTFKFMGARIGVGAGTNADVFLRKNGVDTALGVVGATGAAIATYSDVVDSVAVVAGDLVDFVFRRTAGVGVSISLGLVVGFIGTP